MIRFALVAVAALAAMTAPFQHEPLNTRIVVLALCAAGVLVLRLIWHVALGRKREPQRRPAASGTRSSRQRGRR